MNMRTNTNIDRGGMPATTAPRMAGTLMRTPAAPVRTMHRGGPVKEDGMYKLKKGEHVLTAEEAEHAHKHALMFSGIKSMARSYKAGESQEAETAKPVTKSASTKGESGLKFGEKTSATQHIKVSGHKQNISTSGKSQKAEPGKGATKGPSTSGEPTKMDAAHKAAGSKSSTKDITVRPEHNQAAQVPQQMER